MNAAEAQGAPDWSARMRELFAQAAAVPDAGDRQDSAAAVVRHVLAERPDELARAHVRAEVKRLGLMPLGLFDRLAREVRQVYAVPAAGGLVLPDDAADIPGSPGYAYRPAAARDDDGAVFKCPGHGELLPWAPSVANVYDDAEGRRYYEVTARGHTAPPVPMGELAAPELWERLPVPGTGSKRMRELLANIVLAEAEHAEAIPALTTTGWQESPDGELFYVFADGRAYPERPVYLVGAPAKLREAAGPAASVPPAEVAEALTRIAIYGRGPCVLALGAGIRSLAQSLHKVLGGYVLGGPPNAGKSCAGWHARTVMVARRGRANAWPPLPTATFTDKDAAIESAVHFERDMPALIDDAALHAKSTRAELAAVTATMEHFFRPLANDAPIKERSNIHLTLRPARWVNSPLIATVQDFRAQDSLKRRVFVIDVRKGDVDIPWYRGPDDKPGGNSAGLVGPLRALGEHYVIPFLSALGPAEAAAYVMGRDAAALALLAPELDAEAPGWREQGDGIAGVVDIAAAAVAGVLMAADVIPVADRDLLAGVAVEWAARQLAAQAAELSDSAEGDSVPEALGELVRAAWLDGRGHVRSSRGDMWPAVPGLAEQEQGLELVAHGSAPTYRGRGAAFYYLPDKGAVAVRAEALHKLIRAAADPRLPDRPVLSLARALVESGAALPCKSKRSPWTHQDRVGGEAPISLIFLRPEIIFAGPFDDDDQKNPLHPLHPLQPSSGPENRTQVNAPADAEAAEAFAALVETHAPEVTEGAGDVRIIEPDQPVAGVAGKGPAKPATDAAEAPAEAVDAPPAEVGPCRRCGSPTRVYGPAGRPLCDACSPPPDAAEAPPAGLPAREFPTDQVGRGSPMPADGGPFADLPAPESYSPDEPSPWGWDGRPAYEAPAQRAAADGGGAPSAPRPAQRAASAAHYQRAAHAFLVLGGDGRAYGPEGLVIDAPSAAQLAESCRDVGALAELAMRLGARRLYVPAAVRAALGLPAELPPAESARAGYPHKFAEATSPEHWDIWPAEPVGLAAWMTVYRVPRSGDGVALAFAEWLDRPAEDAPAFGELPPAELARALTLIWQATVYEGKGGRFGGVHFHHSPPATFKRLLQATARRSRGEVPPPVVLPSPFDRDGVAKGGPRLVIPGPHMAPAVAVPEGWMVAELDVRSCYLSAARSTPVGFGEARRARPGELGKLPGVHLVRAPAESAVIDPALFPFLPPARRGQREVGAWLDTVAAAWLAECGVPIRVDESYVWDDARRIFDSPLTRLGAAREKLAASSGAAEQIAAAVVKAAYSRFLGGWLGSDFGGDRSGDDWTANRAGWLTIRAQAETRKQRNLRPMIGAGVLVLGQAQVDSVYVAAPSAEVLAEAPGTGGRPAVAEGRGKFAVKAEAEARPELAAVLGDARASGAARLIALREALAEHAQADDDRGSDRR